MSRFPGFVNIWMIYSDMSDLRHNVDHGAMTEIIDKVIDRK